MEQIGRRFDQLIKEAKDEKDKNKYENEKNVEVSDKMTQFEREKKIINKERDEKIGRKMKILSDFRENKSKNHAVLLMLLKKLSEIDFVQNEIDVSIA